MRPLTANTANTANDRLIQRHGICSRSAQFGDSSDFCRIEFDDFLHDSIFKESEMASESIAQPEHSVSVDPNDEIRFQFMENPFEKKLCRAETHPHYYPFINRNSPLPPPLPWLENSEESILGIPSIWYWMAIGCERYGMEKDDAALPVVVALWAEAFKTNTRQILIGPDFLDNWLLNPRGTDRILKSLHEKGLLLYIIKNRRPNRVILLATPEIDE